MWLANAVAWLEGGYLARCFGEGAQIRWQATALATLSPRPAPARPGGGGAGVARAAGS